MAISATAQLSEPPLSLSEGAGLLTELSEALNRLEQATAKAVDLVGRLQRAGVVEHLEGLPLELLLALQHLTYFARRCHLLVHRQGWEQHLDPQTGELTISRNGRSWRSLPRGTPLSRPPPSLPPGEPDHDEQ